jgi:hypothetical protein
VDGVSFTSGDDLLVLVDDGPGELLRDDRWEFFFVTSEDLGLRIQLAFRDATGTRISGEEFVVNESLHGWTGADLHILKAQDFGRLASGTVVPEPGDLALLGIGLVALIRLHRRTHHRRRQP